MVANHLSHACENKKKKNYILRRNFPIAAKFYLNRYIYLEPENTKDEKEEGLYHQTEGNASLGSIHTVSNKLQSNLKYRVYILQGNCS